MKRILLSLILLISTFFLSAQMTRHIAGGEFHPKREIGNYPEKNLKNNSSADGSRTASYNFFMDYGSVDSAYSHELLPVVSYYNIFPWKLNRRYSNDSSFVIRWAAQIYDTLIDNTNDPIYSFNRYHPATTSLRVDSLLVRYGHLKNIAVGLGTRPDTIVVRLFNNDTLNTLNQADGMRAEQIWSQTIIVDTSMTSMGGGGVINTSLLEFAPNITLPYGSTFSIQVDFYGPQEDEFYVMASYNDACGAACAGQLSSVDSRFGKGQNSWAEFVYKRADGFGFQEFNHNVNIDCNSNSIVEDANCENFYIQNFAFYPKVRAIADFGSGLYVKNNTTCPGESITAHLSVWGASGIPTISWSPTTGIDDPTSANINIIAHVGTTTYTATIVDGIDTLRRSFTMFSNCIGGYVFNDQDMDCVMDTLEFRLNHIPLLLESAGTSVQITSSYPNGSYAFDSLPVGTYTIHIDTSSLPFEVICPSSGYDTIVTDTSLSIVVGPNFAMRCKAGFDVGTVGVFSYSLSRPASIYALQVHAGDMNSLFGYSCNTSSGNIILDYSGPIRFVSTFGGLLPDTVSPFHLVWNISDFSSLNYFNDIRPQFYIDSSALAGELICFNTSVSPVGDRDPSNNTLDQCFPVITSFDPNIKEVSPYGSVTTSEDWLYYTIHFQNTGSSYAENIYVWDTIDSNLDINSIQSISSSHNQTMIVYSAMHAVKFNFFSINLIDSTTDEPNSHGYVQYRIKLKPGLAEGINIKNTASILFDLNAPVLTNTTNTNLCNHPSTTTQTKYISVGQHVNVGTHSYSNAGQFVDILTNHLGCDSIVNTKVLIGTGINEIENMKMTLFPNPANQQLLIQVSGESDKVLCMFDVYGRKVFEKSMSSNQYVLNTEQFAGGTYILQIGKLHQKIIILH